MNAHELSLPSNSPAWVSGLIERHGRALARAAARRGGRGVQGFLEVEHCFLSFLGLPQAQVLAEQPDDAWRMLSLLMGSTPRAIREDQGAAAAVREADWPFLYVRLLLLAPTSGVCDEMQMSDEERREMVRLSRPDGSHLMVARLPAWDEATLDQHIERDEMPVLVHLVASWCKPCQELTPHLEALAAELRGRVRMGCLDVEMHPTLPARFRVRALPTLLLFSGKNLLDRFIGSSSEQGIHDWLDGALKPAAP